MKIYTRNGDKGQTSLGSGRRVSKADLRLEAYGTLDELNAFLGQAVVLMGSVAQSLAPLARLESELQKIQNDLFTLGAHLASDGSTQQSRLPRLPPTRVSDLEHEIDLMTAQIPPLKEFILPGGTELSSLLHVCRTITRRAERCCVRLASEVDLSVDVVEYLNRLSDFLFTTARFALHLQGLHDRPWQKPE